LLETDIPNLSLIAAGDAAGIPFDILGTVEMHDLLQELMEKFDRVVLDGPATLGLADARAVGRFADGVLLVALAGAHEAKPLLRVKQLFDHEGLRPIGVAVNGLRDHHEDVAVATSLTRRPHAAPRPRRAAQARPAEQPGGASAAGRPAEDIIRESVRAA
jgi:Mrp family chromosome partitioning ATPase